MINFLSNNSVNEQLRFGKAIEQWLGFEVFADYRTIKWIRIDSERNGTFSVSFFESFDEGNFDFLDIYEFSPIDPDNQYGLISTFNSEVEALDFASTKYSALITKYVGAGKIQDLYEQFLLTEGLFEE